MTQAFYRKWRPRQWEEVVGQEHVVTTLRNAVAAERIGHAYLFAGPRGTGKTTTARLLAKAVNCLEPDLSKRPCDKCDYCKAVNEGRFLDLIEIDAASNTSVEDVRDLRDKINFSPNQGKYKVYIIDEVHMLSTAAFNALLKTLEEPPAHAIFILATTEMHKIPATVLSRCQRHEFRRIPVNDIVAHLSKKIQEESIQADSEVLTLVARQSTGSLRDAISLLDQLASTGNRITLETAQALLGTAASQAVIDMLSALLAGKAEDGLEQIHRALDSGTDPRQLARQIVDYLRNLLLSRMGNASQIDVTQELRDQMARHAEAFGSLSELLRVIRVFNQAAADARLAWQPALPLELAFVEALEKPTGNPPVSLPLQPARPAAAQPAQPARRTPPETPPAQVESAPKEEGQPETQAEGAGTEARLTIEMILANWKQILALVRQQNPTTQGLLNSSRPLTVKDGVFFLGCNSDFTKSKLEKSENNDLVHQALVQVFGFEVPVRYVIAAGKRGAPPADVDSDGMVATALRDLGGEIVDIQ